jgi:hypothetical protein
LTTPRKFLGRSQDPNKGGEAGSGQIGVRLGTRSAAYDAGLAQMREAGSKLVEIAGIYRAFYGLPG